MSEQQSLMPQLILAAIVLVGCFTVLFTLEGQFAGKATDATSTTAYIVESRPANCSFDVGAGYNLISLPCLSTAVPVHNVTNGTGVQAIYQYVPGSADPWRVYNPNLPAYVVSDLGYMTRRAGYVVIMNESANVTIEGLRVSSTDVPLVEGWNLVGYPAFSVRNVSTAFGALNASITQVVTYNKSTERFISYPGELRVITPGQGYWINATTAASWTVTP